MAFPAALKEKEEEVREGEADMKKAKKSKGKKKKDTEIEKGPVGSEGVTKANRSSMPSLDDENNDACNKKMDKKGKDCGCSHKNDALTPQEYLAACDMGIQDRSRVYIRARLDAAERLDKRTTGGKGKKCGNSYIPATSKCNNGKTFAGGSKDPASVRRGVVVGASKGAQVGAGVAGIAGAIAGYKRGGVAGAARGALQAGVVGGISGGMAGAQYGAIIQGVRKTGRAYGRAQSSNRATQQELQGMRQRKGESGTGYAGRLGKAVQNNQTRVWSPSNEYKNQRQFKKKKRDSVWADGFNADAGAGTGKKCGNSYIPRNAKCNNGRGGGAPSGGGSSYQKPISGTARALSGLSTLGAVSQGVKAYQAAKQGNLVGAAAFTNGAIGYARGAQSFSQGKVAQGFNRQIGHAALSTGIAVGGSYGNQWARSQQAKGMARGAGQAMGRAYGAARGAASGMGRAASGSAFSVEQRMRGFRKMKRPNRSGGLAKRDSPWASGFSVNDAESVLTANAMNLATDGYSNEKRKRNAQGQPRNIIYANTFNT